MSIEVRPAAELLALCHDAIADQAENSEQYVLWAAPFQGLQARGQT